MYEAPELAKGWRFKIKPSMGNRDCLHVLIQKKSGPFWFTLNAQYAWDDGVLGRYENSVPQACRKAMKESGYNSEQRRKEYVQ
jgi:hypothetical protein